MKKENIKSIVFDFGGVITNPVDCLIDCSKLELALGIPRDKIQKAFNRTYFLHPTNVVSPKEFCKKFSKLLGASLTGDQCNCVYYEMEHSFNIKPEILEYIQSLKQEYRIILLSNIYIIERTRAIEKRLAPYFHAMYFSNRIGLAKPDPKIFQFLLDKERLQAADCIFIDDKKENVKAARSLGFHAIEFKGLDELKRSFDKLGIKIE